MRKPKHNSNDIHEALSLLDRQLNPYQRQLSKRSFASLRQTFTTWFHSDYRDPCDRGPRNSHTHPDSEKVVQGRAKNWLVHFLFDGVGQALDQLDQQQKIFDHFWDLYSRAETQVEKEKHLLDQAKHLYEQSLLPDTLIPTQKSSATITATSSLPYKGGSTKT